MDFRYRNLVKEPPGVEELFELAARGGLTISKLVNKGSKTYKDLKINLDDLSEQEIAGMLSSHPKALKRPLLTDGKRLVVGFKTELMEELVAS